MTAEHRADPDALLRSIKRDAEQASSGHLRVFLGMSAGVGKTYAMLEAARERMREGVDVVVGIVETHGRAETVALAQGLPLIPRKKIEYKGVVLEEMDLNAILERHPKLVLVDELAHTNVPGSRHDKRYQDVVELLDAGLDVYTTVNVQHLESRKEPVESITGVTIRETVPDSILERASQIEVIDITPAELLKRLREGKVYLGDKAERAAQNFFKPESLTALREIALRFTAEKVDHELQRLHEAKVSAPPWQTNERLMVAVSHSPHSERLIRATRRLAFNLEAPWVAVHIETGLKLNDEDQAQLAKNLDLARQLNADVVTSADTDIAEALRRIARQKNVTQIVVGRPTRRLVRDRLEGGSLLDRLVRESWEVDVHVIRQDDVPRIRRGVRPRFNFETGFIPYWNTLWLIVGVAVMSGFLEPFLGYRAVGFVFLIGVLAVGLLGAMGPVLFSAVLSAVSWNFFFIPPKLTISISKAEDIMMCFTYLVVAAITGVLTNRVKKHEMIIREREERTHVLYEVLREISTHQENLEFLERVTERVGQVLNGQCAVYVPSDDQKLVEARGEKSTLPLEPKEMAVAQWVFDKGKKAGWSTETLSQATALWLPLNGENGTFGVLAYTPTDDRKLSLEQENLLFSIGKQLGLALERHLVERRLRDSEKLKESEKLHQTLLNSISHEMRTPLTAIMGLAAMLESGTNPDTIESRKDLAEKLTSASDRLNRVIENLLDMSRLNSGAMAIKKEWHDVSDLIGVATQRLARNLADHTLKIEVDDDMPLVEMDFRLMEHALTNLLINATAYTPKGTTIGIRAKRGSASLELAIEDSGPGIPVDALTRVFEKFYRVPGTPSGGTGLGLSIVKSIVEFHKGSIVVENRPEGGARFLISLPLGQPPKAPEEADDTAFDHR